MKKFIMYSLLIFLIMYSCCVNKNHNQSLKDIKMETNYVPNEETAIKIAEAIWVAIYGEKIYDQRPYSVLLKNDSIWVVKGTLNKTAKGATYGALKGGTAYIEIHKSDGKVLKVTHSK